MGQFEHILVGTDLSAEAEGVIMQALALANRHQAGLTLLYAIDGEYAHFQNVLPLKREEFEEMIRQETRRKIIEHFDDSKLETLLENVVVRFGKPSFALLEYADQEDIDLILVGPRNPSALKRIVIGSTAEKLLRHNPQPTFLVHPDIGTRCDTILAPVDFSEASRQALEQAVAFARSEGAMLHILHVCENTTLSSLAGFLPMAEVSGFISVYEKQEHDAFEEFLGTTSYKDVPHEVHFASGPVSQEIVKAAKELHADWIIMGTVGRTGLKGALIGNTAEKVARELPCSMLTFKPALVPEEAAPIPAAS